MSCLKPIVTGSLAVGPFQDAFEKVTCSGDGSANAPLARCPGSETVSAASAAVESTVAVVDAEYVFATPGVNGPKDAFVPSVSASTAFTVPLPPPSACVYGSMPSVFRPSRISDARVARLSMFSRPKPHSTVSSVETPTVLVEPCTTCVALEANCGKLAAGSWFEVGVNRARNAWLLSLNESVYGAWPAIVSAPTAAVVVAWLARENAPIQYCRKSLETFTQFSS